MKYISFEYFWNYVQKLSKNKYLKNQDLNDSKMSVKIDKMKQNVNRIFWNYSFMENNIYIFNLYYLNNINLEHSKMWFLIIY